MDIIKLIILASLPENYAKVFSLGNFAAQIHFILHEYLLSCLLNIISFETLFMNSRFKGRLLYSQYHPRLIS